MSKQAGVCDRCRQLSRSSRYPELTPVTITGLSSSEIHPDKKIPNAGDGVKIALCGSCLRAFNDMVFDIAEHPANVKARVDSAIASLTNHRDMMRDALNAMTADPDVPSFAVASLLTHHLQSLHSDIDKLTQQMDELRPENKPSDDVNKEE